MISRIDGARIGEFEAEHAGKMQLYLTALDELVKIAGGKPFHWNHHLQK